MAKTFWFVTAQAQLFSQSATAEASPRPRWPADGTVADPH